MTIQILRRPAVETKVQLSRSTIYARIQQGTFPKPISLGGRLVGWVAQDIESWLQDRIDEAGRV